MFDLRETVINIVDTDINLEFIFQRLQDNNVKVNNETLFYNGCEYTAKAFGLNSAFFKLFCKNYEYHLELCDLYNDVVGDLAERVNNHKPETCSEKPNNDTIISLEKSGFIEL